MRRFFGRKQIVFLAALAIAAATAVGGYAYFTTPGSGSGTATVGTSTALTITQTGTITGLLPGSAAVPITYTITNSAGNGAQNLGIVSATIGSVTGGSGTCDASNFTVAAASSPVGTIADGATYTSSASTEPTLQMIETGTNQDACQGATVSLSLSAAQGS